MVKTAGVNSIKRETLSGSQVAALLKKPRNKYGVSLKEERTWNGKVFASKGEMKHAQALEMLRKAGQIRKWSSQFPLKMFVNGVHVATHLVDFRVVGIDGQVTYEEFKGYRNPMYNLKMKLLFALDPGLRKIYKIIEK